MEDQTLLQDLMELATHMRQERLFTQYELNNLQTLNEQVLNYFTICFSNWSEYFLIIKTKYIYY